MLLIETPTRPRNLQSVPAEEHTAYRIKVVAFCQFTVSYKDSVSAELLKFMHGWWVKHILESDMKYRTFLTEPGIK